MNSVFTLANQLTLLRMLLIPAFVLLVIYGHLGWALLVFILAGVTDGLDGLAAGQAAAGVDLGAAEAPMEPALARTEAAEPASEQTAG